MAAMQNAGLALEWVRGMLGLDWETAYLEAFAVESGANNLSFLPYLMGERTPHLNPNARGAWVGLALSHTRGHLMRAAFEGVAFAIRDGFEALLETGIQAPSLRLAGGGTKVQLWRQLLAAKRGHHYVVQLLLKHHALLSPCNASHENNRYPTRDTNSHTAHSKPPEIR